MVCGDDLGVLCVGPSRRLGLNRTSLLPYHPLPCPALLCPVLPHLYEHKVTFVSSLALLPSLLRSSGVSPCTESTLPLHCVSRASLGSTRVRTVDSYDCAPCYCFLALNAGK